jgi:hypothetical protein
MGSPERAQEARTVADALTAGQVQGEQFKEELGK